MATQREIEMAVLAYNVYAPTAQNLIETNGWVLRGEGTGQLVVDDSIGFAAGVYKRGNEVVISFRGTSDPQILDYETANVPAAGGWDSLQVRAAIELVADVMADDPDAHISFTGHSLGGGLASLMSAFFGLPSITFDMAPFGLTAESRSVVLTPWAGVLPLLQATVIPSLILSRYLDFYESYQASQNRAPVASFVDYVDAIDAGGTERESMLNVRRALVSGLYLQDEALHFIRAAGLFPTFSSPLERVDIGETTLNDELSDVVTNSADLHSQMLLLALMTAPSLAAASHRLPTLLEQVIDRDLYFRDDHSPVVNFLNRLVADHFNATGAAESSLTRFAEDLLRLGETGSTHLDGVVEGLIATIIEYYYFADETNTDSFVTLGSNSASLDLSRITGPLESPPIKGREALIAGLASHVSELARSRVLSHARDATLWTVQTGVNAMYTSGTEDNEVQIAGGGSDTELHGAGGRDVLIAGNTGSTLDGGEDDDVLLGGVGIDYLYGGAGTDYLRGEAGNDSLIGGGGRDEMYGGAGVDHYNFFADDGSDILLDSDGSGSIWYEGVEVVVGDRIADSTWRSADGLLTITRRPISPVNTGFFTLTIRNDSASTVITVNMWQAGHLGLVLEDTAIEADPATLPPTSMITIDPADPNSPEGQEGARFAHVYGTAANDLVYTRSLLGPGGYRITAVDQGGDDTVVGGAGVDEIYGGAGDDWISGGGAADKLVGDMVEIVGDGSDSLAGGANADLIYGEGGDDELWANERQDVSAAIALADTAPSVNARGDYMFGGDGVDTALGSNQWDYLSGGSGRDLLIGMGGDDLILGDLHYQLLGSHPIPVIEQPDFQWYWTIQREIVTQPDGSFIYSAGLMDTGGVSVEDTELGDADTVYAGSGNDIVLGGDGDDFIDGGADNDLLAGEVGNDILIGGTGDDILDGGDASDVDGADLLDGGDGDDTLLGANGADTLFGGAGNDRLGGDDADANAALGGADYIDGGSGNDTMFGGARSDTLLGADGNDRLYGDDSSTPIEYHGDDHLDGGAGEDYLVGLGGSDTLYGGASNDELFGDASGIPSAAQGQDHLDGGSGDDTLIGGGNGDRLFGGEGTDRLHGDGSGLTAEDQGNDYLDGGTEKDYLYGYGGNDILLGGDGDDELMGDHPDAPVAAMGSDVMSGGNGNDFLWAYGGADTLDGGEGTDYMDGGEGDDELDGGSGNDTLIGGAGNDALQGGAGIDVLRGGMGNDAYTFAAADMLLVGATADGIIDTEGNNRIVFSDLSLSDFTVSAGAESLAINLSAANGTIGLVILNALSGAISELEFADGSVLSMYGLLLSRYNGIADQQSFAEGASIYGGSQADTLYAYGDDAIVYGGRGNDSMGGGSGRTTYRFTRGDGTDSIYDASTFVSSGGANRNLLELGGAIVRSDVTLNLAAGSASLRLGLGAGDAIVLGEVVSISNIITGPRTLDAIMFEDGSIVSWEQLLASSQITITNTSESTYSGTNSHDRIVGSSIAETVFAGAGDDLLLASGGSDTLSGGQGSDTYYLRQGSGSDTINNFDNDTGKVDRLLIDATIADADLDFFRIGQSLLVRVRNSGDQVFISDYFGAAGLDEIVLPDGTVYTSANVPWQGQAQNVLTFNVGQGARTVTIADPIGFVADTLRFGAGVDPATVVFSNVNGDLQIRVRSPSGSFTSDSLTIVGGFGNSAAHLDRIEFMSAPDLILTGEDVIYRAGRPTDASEQVIGTEQNDVIDGLGGSDQIYGYGGDDVLYGQGDALYGGDGNDMLHSTGGGNSLDGGAGSDTYIINVDGGSNVIGGFDADTQSTDVLMFGTLIDPASLRFFQDGLDLFVQYDDPSTTFAQVRITGFFDANRVGQTIDQIRFADAPGLVLGRAEILAAIAEPPTAGSDVVSGTTGSDTLLGLGGNDTLNGLAGNDDLDGGIGNDSLNGGDGSDIYRFGVGSGIDLIFDNVGANRVMLAAGVLPGDVTLIRTHIDYDSSADLIIRLSDHDQLRIASYNPSYLASIEFANGTIWSAADIAARLIDRTTDANTQTGTSGNDVFTVDSMRDVVNEPSSAGGADTINASVTYALPTNVENLTLLGTEHIAGSGNALNNIITGNTGNNSLFGGTGADTLIGGAGDDTYTVNATSEIDQPNDTVVESAGGGYDTVIFDVTYGGELSVNVERAIFRAGNQYYVNNPAVVRGNALDNEIIVQSNPFNNAHILDGGAGADRMVGSNGSEIYVVDNVGDRVEEVGSGRDTVRSYVQFVLPSLVERLELWGTNAINGTGTNFDNELVGSTNTAANVLTGLHGDDVYFLGQGDTVVELAGGGMDTIVVERSGAIDLANFQNVENVRLSEAAGQGTSVYGDAGNNTLTGNRNINHLYGGDGDDTIIDSNGNFLDADELFGGAGNDTLYSYNGNDTMDGGAGDDQLIITGQGSGAASFLFGRGDGYDTVSNDARGAHVVRFDADVTTADVRVARDGQYIYVYVGSSERLRLRAFSDATSWTFASTFGGVYFGTTLWSAAEVQAAIQSGTGLPSADSDVLNGTSERDRIDGGAGDDTIAGLAGDDRLDGNLGNDQLSGGAGVDSLVGGAGNDVLTGGAGADTYYFSAGFGQDTLRDTEAGQSQDNATDTVRFDATISRSDIVFLRSDTDPADLWVSRRGTGDRLTVQDFFGDPTAADHIEQFVFADGTVVTGNSLRGVPTIEGTNDADTLQAGSVGSTLNGYSGNDMLAGGSGADTLNGGAGADSMSGGGGNDRYFVDQVGDVVIEAMGAGDDSVVSLVSLVLPDNVENLQLDGTASINATGNDGGNRLVGNDASNWLDGGAGGDTMIGGGGDDFYVFEAGGDSMQEFVGGGYDTVYSWRNHALGENVEALVLLGIDHLLGRGNSANNYIRGNDGDNALDGELGADILVGGRGNDNYVIDDIGDVVVEAPGEGNDTIGTSVSYRAPDNVETTVASGTSALNLSGNALANTLSGNSAVNVLDGDAGADMMAGWEGNDTYIVDNAGDVAFELLGEGDDLVISSVDRVLDNQVERLRLTGAAISATGNALNNVIEGNSLANIIDGGAGTDSMSGGAGDDVYVVSDFGDTVTELQNAGIDTVRSAIDFSLGNHIENLELVGTAVWGAANELANRLIGNAQVNQLSGGGGDDWLDGGSGNDFLYGDSGNDTYIVDHTNDLINESSNAGTDLVRSSVTFTLAANVEDLELTGSANINGTGNSSVNRLVGNTGNNTLNGGLDADSMIGGTGNDIYVVDNAGDVVTEGSGEGIDTVQSTLAWTLGDALENLTLTGSNVISGTGNALDNVLIGNTAANTLTGGLGNDTLDGGSGADTLLGGQGNDSYIVDNANDVVTEAVNEGIDSMTIHVERTLSAYVDLLFMAGTSNLAGTGNELANLLRGNVGNNTLTGGGGTDILEGGGGNDVVTTSVANGLLNGGAGTDTLNGSASNDLLIGGAGNDTIVTGTGADIIVFNRGDGQDTVAASTSRDNVLSIGGAAYADLLFQKSGNHLILGVGTDRITFTDYYTNPTNPSIRDLQIVIGGTSEYAPLSGNALRDNEIETFDFAGLVAAFDAARTANPTLTSWALTNALLAEHLSGSDTAAYGGDLAYRYNRFGTLGDISFTPATSILAEAGFGANTQVLRTLSSLQHETARLS